MCVGTRTTCAHRWSTAVRVQHVSEVVRPRSQSQSTPGRPQRRAKLRMSSVRQVLQEIVDPVNAPAHPLRHAAVPVPVLRKTVPPEVRHEETHLHPYR